MAERPLDHLHGGEGCRVPPSTPDVQFLRPAISWRIGYTTDTGEDQAWVDASKAASWMSVAISAGDPAMLRRRRKNSMAELTFIAPTRGFFFPNQQKFEAARATQNPGARGARPVPRRDACAATCTAPAIHTDTGSSEPFDRLHQPRRSSPRRSSGLTAFEARPRPAAHQAGSGHGRGSTLRLSAQRWTSTTALQGLWANWERLST